MHKLGLLIYIQKIQLKPYIATIYKLKIHMLQQINITKKT